MSVLLIAVAVFTYFGAISLMVKTWMSRNTYSHGFLIPMISLYLVWLDRERLKDLPIRPSIIGGMLGVLASCLLLITGMVSGVSMVQQISLLILIPSVILALFGPGYLKVLALPVTYLIFMVPILDVLITRIQWPFQILTATMAVNILNILGVPVFLSNQLIELPSGTLEVAKACSGVQYLVSITAVAIPLAYFSLHGTIRRVGFVLIAIVVGIMTNWLRVVLIALWSYMGGAVLHGPMHIFQGLFVSIFGFIVLFFISIFIKKAFPTPTITTKDVAGNEVTNVAMPVPQINGFRKAWAITFIVLLGVGGYIYLYKEKPVALKVPLEWFSPRIHGWWVEKNLDSIDVPFAVVGADEEIHRIYVNPSGRKLHLYIGYFESQHQGKELIHYTLDSLYSNTKEIKIDLNDSKYVTINNAIVRSGKHRYMTLYWHELNGRTVANRYHAKVITAIDGIIKGKTNGALVVVYSVLDPQDDREKLLNVHIEFIKAINRSIKEYLPST